MLWQSPQKCLKVAWNKIKSPEINPLTYGQLNYKKKEAKYTIGKRQSLQ